MATTKTVSVRSVVAVGLGTVVAHAATAPIGSPYSYSLHDVSDAAKAGAHNEIWPRGAGAVVTFKQGLAVHHRDAGNTTSVQVTVS